MQANLTIADARERTIQQYTQLWLKHLTELCRVLKAQGFSDEETLELCENMKPRFEENLTHVIAQFDNAASDFIDRCRKAEGENLG